MLLLYLRNLGGRKRIAKRNSARAALAAALVVSAATNVFAADGERKPIGVKITACPTTNFIVYFEWNQSALNQAALETLNAAIERARVCEIESVVVVGHTDTSGSTQHNIGLSERRASVVRDALAEQGIPADVIHTEARGETDPARPTRDGVREPLNRRTAVIVTSGSAP